MHNLPKPAQYYIISIGVLAVVVSVATATVVLSRLDFLVTTLALAGMIAFLDLFPIIVQDDRVEMTISTAIRVATVLIFDPSIAILATLLGTALSEVRFKRALVRKIFNMSQMTITYTLVAFVYHAVREAGVGVVDSPRNILAVGALALTDMVVNSLLVSMVVALAEGISVRYVWSENFRPVIWHEMSMIPMGVFIAILWRVSPVAALFTAAPLLLVRHSYEMAGSLRRQTLNALMSMARMLDERDEHTIHHCELVAQHAEQIAKALDLGQGEVEIVKRSAYLHDIGKISMSNEILFKPDTLTPLEREMAKKHAALGAELLSQFPIFERGALYVRHHHERWDGGGYPDGLKGTEIPLGARILAVSDSFQAMIEDRPYRRALSLPVALHEIHDNSGTQFDPMIVQALFKAKNNVYPPPAAMPEAIPAMLSKA
jgi:putative nucleotidyltransferase with HDIG domain